MKKVIFLSFLVALPLMGCDESLVREVHRNYGNDVECVDRAMGGECLRFGRDIRFEIDRYEVTQEKWNRVMGDLGVGNPSFHNDCPSCPVERINLFEAAFLADRLSELEGYEKCYGLGTIAHVAENGSLVYVNENGDRVDEGTEGAFVKAVTVDEEGNVVCENAHTIGAGCPNDEAECFVNSGENIDRRVFHCPGKVERNTDENGIETSVMYIKSDCDGYRIPITRNWDLIEYIPPSADDPLRVNYDESVVLPSGQCVRELEDGSVEPSETLSVGSFDSPMLGYLRYEIYDEGGNVSEWTMSGYNGFPDVPSDFFVVGANITSDIVAYNVGQNIYNNCSKRTENELHADPKKRSYSLGVRFVRDEGKCAFPRGDDPREMSKSDLDYHSDFYCFPIPKSEVVQVVEEN